MEQKVRKALRTCKPDVLVDIRLYVSAFRPEDEPLPRAADAPHEVKFV